MAEVHRVLRPGGALVLSVHHPITGWSLSPTRGYHRTELVDDTTPVSLYVRAARRR